MHPNVNACNCHIKLIARPPQEEDQKQSVVVTNCIPGGQFLRSFSEGEREGICLVGLWSGGDTFCRIADWAWWSLPLFNT